MQCLLCRRRLRVHYSFKELLLPVKLREPVICQDCRNSFVKSQAVNPCPGCHRPLPAKHDLCPDCQYWQDKLGWVLPAYALYQYNAAMKEFMHAYKFQGDYRLRKVFKAELTQAVKDVAEDSLIAAIPVTKATMQRRGFNQVKGMLDLPLADLLLTIDDDKRVPQSSKDRAGRLQTPQPFKLSPGAVQRLRGHSVVLVDDVYTTGRTLYHAAGLIKKAGASRLIAVTLAH